jgi:hypothetical protein
MVNVVSNDLIGFSLEGDLNVFPLMELPQILANMPMASVIM